MDTTLNKSLVFFISEPSNLDNMDKVLDTLTQYDDICITSDKDVSLDTYANIPLFYLKFADIDIVFFTISSYLEHRNIFSPERIILAISSQEYLSNNIDPRTLSIKKIIEL